MNSFTSKSKRGGNSGKKSAAGYIVLLIVALISFGFIFLTAAESVFLTLHETGNDWLYFSLLSLIALMLSVVGSAFMTYSALYKAKDNEFLFSMPIPQRMILLARMCGCYLIAFVFTAIVIIPTFIIWCVNGMFSVLSLIFCVAALFILPLLSLSISCLLGWIIALIAPHVRHKSLVTTAVSMLFLAVYFLFYMNAQEILQSLLVHSEKMEGIIRSWIFPIYMLGRGLTGEVVPFVIFALFAIVVFCVVWGVMSHGFVKLATASGKSKKIVYHEKKSKAVSFRSALIRREFMHYKSSPAYILNTTMGSMFMVMLSVFAIVQAGNINGILNDLAESYPDIKNMFPVIIGAIIGMLVSYNLMTVPSVSLEGRSIWLIRSLPLKTQSILESKLVFHLIMTLPFSVISTIIMCAVIKADILTSAFVMLFIIVYNVTSAAAGLILSVKRPNLSYTDEATAIKQNWSVTIIMLGGMAVMTVFILIGFLARSIILPWLYVILSALVLAFITYLELRWICGKGVELFEELN